LYGCPDDDSSIDIWDAKAKKLVWRCSATAVTKKDPEAVAKQKTVRSSAESGQPLDAIVISSTE